MVWARVAMVQREPYGSSCGRRIGYNRRMAAWVTPADGDVDRDRIAHLLRAEGGEPSWWSNDPGEVDDPHEHGFHKVLFCADGSIVFVVDDEQLFLTPGDRLDVEPRTLHAAVVGPDGVTCGEVAVG